MFFILLGGSMDKEKNVIRYYVLCNKLKNVIRTGWKDWNVKRVRVESVAEHIYSTQMLAIAMYSEFEYELDIKKILYMLAVHELEEIIIGDLTMFQISKDEKRKKGIKAVNQVLGSMLKKDEIKSIIEEFEDRKTKEALFAYYCDKLECDLQCKLYDEEECVNVKENDSINDEKVRKMLNEDKTWSNMWLLFSQETYGYDENFMKVSNYAINNNINNLLIND